MSSSYAMLLEENIHKVVLNDTTNTHYSDIKSRRRTYDNNVEKMTAIFDTTLIDTIRYRTVQIKCATCVHAPLGIAESLVIA